MNTLKYTAAYTLPLSALLGIWLGGWWSFLTPVYAFLAIPLLETLLPQDNTNLKPADRAADSINPVFDFMLYVNLIIVYGLIWFVGEVYSSNPSFSLEWVGVAFSLGIVLGTNGINVGHELGHRQQSWERFLGKMLLLPSFYMHFYIEHNFGHHQNAATPDDPATAKINQTLYSFWITSVVRQYINAWRIQADLLKRQSRPFISLYNDMMWFTLFQLVYAGVLFMVFGIQVCVLLVASGLVGVLLLESVNYIEHYGLLRNRLPSGRYERVRAMHSWNSNHVVGRIVLYELTRHSDHHYKSSKKYQILDYHEQSPEMPYGYPTSLVIALIPPLWFRLMNPRIPQEMKGI
jgi:alkane 1-monooxygenase